MSRIDELLREAQDHARAGRHDAALPLVMRALRAEPNHAGALRAAVICHEAKGDFVRAIYFAKQARLAHDSFETRNGLAALLAVSGKTRDALDELSPLTDGPRAHPRACFHSARFLCDLGLSDESARRARAWADRWPNEPNLWQVYVEAIARLGDAAEQVAAIREGLSRFPNHRPFAEWLASTALYVDDMAESEILALARANALLVAYHAPAPARARRPASGAVRLGLISPDLRAHSVAYFLRPLMQNLDRARTPIYLYDNGDVADAVNAELRTLAVAWRGCRTATPEQIAEAVRRDDIDVLIDLAGLTRGSSTDVLARRPAPVQVTFLGYAGLTCLPGYDYRIVDSLTDPPETDARGAEKRLRLDPCFLCYQPAADIPPLAASDTARPVTFGSFNALPKTSPKAIALWSRVMQAVPRSRMVIKAWGLECEAARSRVQAIFASHGVTADRLDLLALNATPREHLAEYARMDIALDTQPYNGTTTTCEALSMGVPVVTRVGEPHRSRVGFSLLSAVGLPELAARDDDAFVKAAASLANDPARRAAMRAPDGLRATMLASPLCDAPAYARRFEALLRSLVKA